MQTVSMQFKEKQTQSCIICFFGSAEVLFTAAGHVHTIMGSLLSLKIVSWIYTIYSPLQIYHSQNPAT